MQSISYQQFLDARTKLINIPAPGLQIQLKMAAMERLESIQKKAHLMKDARRAAVQFYLYPKEGQTYFLLIKRAVSKGKHSGQIALPGGKAEPEDVDYAATAVRECWEEVGVAPEDQKVLCAASPLYIPPSHFFVHPFIAYLPRELNHYQLGLSPQIEEVAAIYEVPLVELMNAKEDKTMPLTTGYMTDVRVPYYQLQGQMVWGATAMILAEIKHWLKLGLIKNKE